MDRNREARRATSIVGSNGFNKRRHRTNSLRDSPDEEGGIELQESARLRERVKKDRDRERERERERERDLRERERERDLRERSSRSSSKRRRAERLATNRDDIGGDETTDESFNEDDDEEDEHTATAAAAVRSFPPPQTAAAGSISNHHHHNQNHSFSTSFSQQHSSSSGNIMSSNNNHLQHRKSFPLSSSSAKVLRAPPVWKSGDEMISASVPRKARSASTKRLHDWISSSSNNNSSGGGVEQNPGQVSDSPVGQAPVSASPPLQIPAAAAAPLSPSSSNASARKKLKTSISNPGQKLKPPQKVSSSSKPSSSNPEELEIEIAEVLYGLMTQSQGPSSSSKKEDSREVKNSEANTSSPLSAVAPKRKRPRQIPENSVYRDPVPAKPGAEQMPKIEILSPNLEKISGSGGEIGYEMGGNSVISQAEPPVPAASESTKLDLELNSVVEELRENRDLVAKEEVTSPKEKESPALRTLRTENSSNMDLQSTTVIKENLVSLMENRKEEKFEIDLMAPPPQVRSSPERDNKIASKASTVDPKPIFSIDDALSVPKNKEDEKGSTNVAAEEKKGTGLIEEAESHKEIESKGRNIDLHLDLEKSDRDGCAGFNSTVNKSQPQIHKQMPFKPTKEEPPTDKSGHVTSSLPLPLPMPMSVANWPGGLSPMGYMAPLQGVVSMDGSGVTPSHMQPLFSQPRPKRCATHCHIARNIHCLQQYMKMNPFWPGPTPPPASLFGSTRPPAHDPNVNVTVRGGNNNNPDNKAHSPNHSGKEKISQPNINSDSSQRKQQQILIQQPLPPSVSPPNLLGPTFIFPLNHQQQQAAAARPSSAKSPAASSASSAAAATSAAAAAAAAMSFNYPNMAPANETQYVAIMQNNGYPFPMPAVGPPPNYRGPAMPLFNGSFYSPQMIHPSQLLQQNASAPSNSSSSQKHLQSQQQQNPSSNKTQPPQQYAQHQSRPRHHLEGDQDNNSSPSTNDSSSRGYRPPMSMYGQNFAMMHPQNFALMTHPPPPQNEKKGAHQASKGGGEPLPQHSFAMSFGPVNGTSGDMMTSSMAQNQTMFQNSAQNMMISSMAAHKKSFRISDDGKSGSADSSGKAALGGGGGGGGGQSIAFTRGDSPVSSIQANNSVIESSARSLNNASSSAHSSRAVAAANVVGPTSVQNAHIAQLHHHQQQQQQQLQQLQQQQMMQFKQQQHQLAASRSKVVPPPTNNTAGSNNNNIYSDQLNLSSSTMAAKFQNAQNHVQSNTSSNGGAQSPQWRSSTTKTPSSLAVPPPTTTATTTLKNIPQHQQHSRNQPQLMHTQISFSGGSNQKPPSASPQGGQGPPPPSSPMMVGGSPTTSSVSKGGPGGSPRTTSSASTSNKTGQGSSYSVQSIMPNQRSPSILGNPNVTSSSSSAPKAQMPKTMQQTQMFFSNMYSQSQPPHSTSNSPNASGPGPYYTQRRRQDQLAPGSAPTPAVGPTSANTNDPAIAIAAATKGGGGGGLPPSQGVMHAMLPAGFSYVHPVPAAVPAKPSEQKQTVG
ncbi:hypothetical protein ABFX02_07G030100 [Erythranthe guttata]